MKVDILIINYKSHDIINKCLESINEEFIEIEIHILNNDPNIQLCEYPIKTNYKIDIYDLKKNIGYSSGVNFLVEKVRNTNYFFLLNPDALLTKNAIKTLLRTAQKNSSIAAVSPAIFDMDNNPWFNYGKIDWKTFKVINVSTKLSKKSIIENDLFNGCAVLMKKDAFLKAGGLLNELFMYYDEAFLSMSLQKLGYKIFLNSNVKAFHNVSYTTKDNNSIKTFFITRNGLAFFFKYSNKKAFLLLKYFYNGFYYLKHFNLSNLLSYYHALFVFPFVLKKLK